MSMWKNERHQRISRMVAELKSVTTDRLVDDLSVSRETVRRDLLDMEALGLVRRVHGGAVATDSRAEPPLDVRSMLHVRAKQQIAQAACKLITDHKVVYFDAGSTTKYLAQQLSAIHGLHVITNSLETASALFKAYASNRNASSVTLLGGSLGPLGFATSGVQTIKEIGRVKADIAFVSPAAIDPKDGAVSAIQQEAEIAAAMLDNSQQNAVLADASKFGANGYYRYCTFDQMDALVTDTGIHSVAGFPGKFGEAGTKIIVAA